MLALAGSFSATTITGDCSREIERYAAALASDTPGDAIISATIAINVPIALRLFFSDMLAYPFDLSDDYMTAARTRAILSASVFSPFTI